MYKHTIVGPLLQVAMREAHFQVKMLKTQGCGSFLALEMSKKCTPLWREGQRADFLRGVAFWSIRCSGLLR